MKITNKIQYSDKLTVISTSYPNSKYPSYRDYGLTYPNEPTYFYYINMSFDSTFQAHWYCPTTEIIGLQGINTLIVIDKIFKVIEGFSIDDMHTTVIVNCDAGVNRSYNVVECFNYLKTGNPNNLDDYNRMTYITEFLKRIEKRDNIEQVIYAYIGKLIDNGIINLQPQLVFNNTYPEHDPIFELLEEFKKDFENISDDDLDEIWLTVNGFKFSDKYGDLH
jgi:hypothetical protein